MKSLTDQLVESSNGLLNKVPEIRDETGYYTMCDDGGVEHEVGNFLYGLVKILQPKHILETGTYTGVSALYMGQALKDNRHGDLVTLEVENTHKLRAEALWRNCEVAAEVTCELKTSLEYNDSRLIQAGFEYDLLFLDSEPQYRFAELVKFFPYLKEGGYIGIHDLPNTLCQGNVNPDHPEMKSYPYGDLPEQIKEWLKTDKLRMIHFPSPRGLTFFYKTTEKDFRP